MTLENNLKGPREDPNVRKRGCPGHRATTRTGAAQASRLWH